MLTAGAVWTDGACGKQKKVIYFEVWKKSGNYKIFKNRCIDALTSSQNKSSIASISSIKNYVKKTR